MWDFSYMLLGLLPLGANLLVQAVSEPLQKTNLKKLQELTTQEVRVKHEKSKRFGLIAAGALWLFILSMMNSGAMGVLSFVLPTLLVGLSNYLFYRFKKNLPSEHKFYRFLVYAYRTLSGADFMDFAKKYIVNYPERVSTLVDWLRVERQGALPIANDFYELENRSFNNAMNAKLRRHAHELDVHHIDNQHAIMKSVASSISNTMANSPGSSMENLQGQFPPQFQRMFEYLVKVQKSEYVYLPEQRRFATPATYTGVNYITETYDPDEVIAEIHEVHADLSDARNHRKEGNKLYIGLWNLERDSIELAEVDYVTLDGTRPDINKVVADFVGKYENSERYMKRLKEVRITNSDNLDNNGRRMLDELEIPVKYQ